jgi:hypothetical protein
MRNDTKTMSRLSDYVYGSKYKSAKQLVITKVLSCKKVGESII